MYLTKLILKWGNNLLNFKFDLHDTNGQTDQLMFNQFSFLKMFMKVYFSISTPEWSLCNKVHFNIIYFCTVECTFTNSFLMYNLQSTFGCTFTKSTHWMKITESVCWCLANRIPRRTEMEQFYTFRPVQMSSVPEGVY